ncbi:MAG: archaeosine biosynthesis radical SAM protein RaSEA [Candidatus Parcubacteria bacterium]|nr:archaeosine biosynthesis radical SAM protein RaSEA [Candidatus Parcubacteria bacterium]
MDFSFIDKVFEPFWQKLVDRWVLELPGAGCEWYKKTGGCTMCGFNQSTYKYTFGGKLYPHFVFMLIFLWARFLIRKARPEIMVIYNGGSFLSDKEIPLKTQLAILNFVRRHPTIKKIMVESRAEFVTEAKLQLYKNAIGNKELEIALGLESADDKVRNECLHKGLTKATFENAVKLCKVFGFQTFAYVFLKPHCLNEKEAIEDAVKSIEYCFQVGVDEVSLSCAFVQEGTLLHELYQSGEFQPPTLWSIIEVIQRTAHLGPVRIGSFDDDPPPIAKPHNCGECDHEILVAIEHYRQTQDPTIFTGLNCACKK